MTKLVQWNLNSLKEQYESLQVLIANEKADIICLQETNLKLNQTIKLKNFSSYNKTRQDCLAASGGVSILINNDIYRHEIMLNTELEAIATQVLINNRMITICNIYLSNKYNLSNTQLDNLITQLPQPYLLLEDFNSHSTLWGSHKTDNRGKIVENLLINNNLVLLNDSAPTYCNETSGKASSIDLTLCSSNISTSLSWNALDYLYGSDHFPITVTLDNTQNTDKVAINRYKFYKADWIKYQDKINSKIEDINKLIEESEKSNDTEINNIISKFNEIIFYAANESIPISKYKKGNHNLPWWNEECEVAVKNSKKALNKLKKHNTLDNSIEHKRLKAIVKRTIKDSKKKSWLEFLRSIDYQIPINEIWKKIKSIEGKNFPQAVTIKENDQVINNPDVVANALAMSFANNSSDNNLSPEFLSYKNSREPLVDPQGMGSENSLNYVITMEELKSILEDSNNTSPGPDMIPNILLKQLPTKGYECLLKIYNIIWKKNIFPELWKKATVIPILKPGKNKHDINSYRPIALTCCMCKTLEKIINQRLKWFLESSNILNYAQSGFREKCSTTDCLVTLESHIRDAFAQNQHMLTVCLDMNKAYDLLWQRRILETLQKLKTGGNMYHFINNFLPNRTIQVRINNTYSKSVDIINEVPQGSVISVTLFLLAINDVTKNIKAPVMCTIFADDITLFTKGKNLKSSVELMQSTLNSLQEYTNTSDFQFSPQKTQAIVFDNSRRKAENPILLMNSKQIQIVQEIKILGLIFDRKLTWKSHIESLKNQ